MEMQDVKILMVGPARSVNGGISAVVNNYYEAGLDSKVDIEYIGTMEDGSKWHKLSVAIKALCTFLTSVGQADIVHIHMASDVSIYRKLPFIWITKFRKKKLIIHQHGGNIENFYYEVCGNRRRHWIQKSLNQTDRFLVVAPYLKDVFSKIIEENKILVLPNSIPVPDEFDKDYSCKKLVFMGRLCKEKGIGELLDAVAYLKKEFTDLELFLGGVWVDETLKKKADSMGEFVHQLGWIDTEARERYLRECNIFVLPTYFEGLPMSLLEGMAYGCACVASEVGGIPQVIEHGRDGILIPAKDVTALTEALRRVLSDVQLQQNMGKNSIKVVKEKYNIQKAMDGLLNEYKKVSDIHS